MFSPLNLEEIKKIVRFLTNIKFSSLERSLPERMNSLIQAGTERRGEVVDLSLHSPSLIQFGSIELVSGLLLIVSG